MDYIGIAIPLTFGIFALFVFFYNRKYSGKITFVQDEHFDLYDSLMTNISDLQILYRNEPIDENRYLFRGYIVNNGSCDLTDGMVEIPLSLKIKKGGKWLSAKVLKKSDDLIIDLIPEDENLSVKFGLFRKKEFFQFESLIECEEKEDFLKQLTFSHRIAGTKKVDKVDDLPEAKAISLMLASILGIVGFIITIFIFMINLESEYYFNTFHAPFSRMEIEKDSLLYEEMMNKIRSHSYENHVLFDSTESENDRIMANYLNSRNHSLKVEYFRENMMLEKMANTSLMKLLFCNQDSKIHVYEGTIISVSPDLSKLKILRYLCAILAVFAIFSLIIIYRLYKDWNKFILRYIFDETG